MANISILRSFLTYGVGNIMYSLITLTLVPFYLEKLDVQDYGILTLFLIAGNIITIFFSMNMSNAILRLFTDQECTINRKNVLSSVFIFIGVIFLLIWGLSCSIPTLLSKIIFNNTRYTDYVFITVGWGFMRIIFQTIQGTLRAINKPVLYVLLSIVDILFLAGLNISIIYFTDFTLKDVFLSYIYSSILTIFFGSILVRKYLSFSFNLNAIKYIIAYGLPLSIANILSYLINYGNRFFLIYFTNESNVAIFDVSQKIANLVGLLLVNAFLTSFTPYYLNLYNSIDFKTFQSRVNKLFLNFTSIFFLFAMLIVIGDDIFLNMLSKVIYLDSANYVPLLILSNFLYVTFMVTTMGTNILKTTKIEMYITIISVIVSLILNYILIYNWGLWGAALSQVGVNLLTIIIMSIYNRKYFPIKFNWMKITQIISFFLLLSLCNYAFVNLQVNIGIAILGYMFVFTLYLFKNKEVVLELTNKLKYYCIKIK